MKDIWERIENYLKSNFIEIYDDLLPGATDEEIKEAENYLKIHFPEDIKESFKIHNGQKGDAGWLIDGWKLLSLEGVMEEWDKWNDILRSGDFEDVYSTPKGMIRPDWWNYHWIPLTHSGQGDHNCLDLIPLCQESYGQIITVWKDMPERDLVARDFKSWLNTFADNLEAERYMLAEEYDGLVIKE